MLIHYSPRAHESVPAFLSPNGGPTTPFSLDPPDAARSAAKVRRRAPRRREHSAGARAVMGFFGELDDAIRDATGNTLDLKVLIPLVAGVLGIVLLPRTRSTPLWLTLMIFAFSSFLMLHEPGTPEAEVAELAAELV